MQFSEEKQATMRAAFQADLSGRLSEIEDLAREVRSGHLSAPQASAAALAHLHDIKGCGTAFGCPEASDLARRYEAVLLKPAASPAALAEVLAAAARELRQFAMENRNR